MADIVREIDAHLELDFYGCFKLRESDSLLEVKIIKDLDTNVEGRDLLICRRYY